jgi:hypothetical protein
LISHGMSRVDDWRESSRPELLARWALKERAYTLR